MLEDGLSYPARGDWIGRIIIGGVLGFLWFLAIPIVFLNGYLYRVLKGTIDGEDVPPEFTEWGDLFVKGVGVTVIAVVYAIVPLAIYGLIVGVFLGAGSAVGSDGGGFLAGIGALAAVLMIPVLLFAYYVIPAAIANYARTGDIAAGFDVSVITTVVFTTDYLAAILMPVVIGVLLWIVSVVLVMTIIGVVLLPFVQFYGQVAIFRMFGTAFDATAPVDV